MLGWKIPPETNSWIKFVMRWIAILSYPFVHLHQLYFVTHVQIGYIILFHNLLFAQQNFIEREYFTRSLVRHRTMCRRQRQRSGGDIVPECMCVFEWLRGQNVVLMFCRVARASIKWWWHLSTLSAQNHKLYSLSLSLIYVWKSIIWYTGALVMSEICVSPGIL